MFLAPSDDDDDDDGDLNSGPMSSERDDYDLSKRDVSFYAPKLRLSMRALLTSRTRTSRQKNRRRRNRKKRSKQKRAQEKKEQAEQQQQKKEAGGEKEVEKEKTSEVEIEYVTEEPEIYDPNFIFFKRIFEAFKVTQRTT